MARPSDGGRHRARTYVAESRKAGAPGERAVERQFDRAAATFDGADFVHRYTANGLFERLTPMLLEADRILDAGAATGTASRELSKRFRRGHVISVDRSMNMLKVARRSRWRFARIAELRASAMSLPLQTAAIDLVFANLLLPWLDDPPSFFSEVARVLRKDGLFLFSTLGPDSLGELRGAWDAIDGDEHVHEFADMHDVGDALLRSGLRDPVLDVDYLTVTYPDIDTLFRDLGRAGARNRLPGRRPTLTGRRRFERMRQKLAESFSGASLPLELELVFGHAWGSGSTATSGEVRIDVRDIGRSIDHSSR